jgi:hypothetical protein
VTEKNPVFVEAGRRGARRRWGEVRVVRLAELDGDTARLIRALLAQKKAAPVSETSGTAEPEVRRAGDERPAA